MPLHKLTGWITYSLIEPIEKVLRWKIEGIEYMTGLPEYRNGMALVLETRYRGVADWDAQAACWSTSASLRLSLVPSLHRPIQIHRLVFRDLSRPILRSWSGAP